MNPLKRKLIADGRSFAFVAPIPAGGSTDRLVRQVAQQLQKRVGQPVTVENRPGGSSSIGTAHVAKAAPDGYMLVLVNGSMPSIRTSIRAFSSTFRESRHHDLGRHLADAAQHPGEADGSDGKMKRPAVQQESVR